MKKIKIFIASSAELNEDKQMFDLYFSDKNKLYRDRNIVIIAILQTTFIQRT